MNYISYENPYTFDELNYSLGLLTIWCPIERRATFKVKGSVSFYHDSNGVGFVWTGYNADDVSLEFIPEDSDIAASEVEDAYVLELLVQAEYNYQVNYALG